MILEKEETDKKLKEIFEKLGSLLDKKILEKYIYLDLSGKAIAEKYADDCVYALLEDEEFKILGVIDEIKEKISSGEISIKNSLRIFEKLGVEKENFNLMRENLISLNKKVKELETKIGEINLGLDDLFKEKIEIENKIAGLKNNIESLRKKEEKIVGVIKELEKELISAGKI